MFVIAGEGSCGRSPPCCPTLSLCPPPALSSPPHSLPQPQRNATQRSSMEMTNTGTIMRAWLNLMAVWTTNLLSLQGKRWGHFFLVTALRYHPLLLQVFQPPHQSENFQRPNWTLIHTMPLGMPPCSRLQTTEPRRMTWLMLPVMRSRC